MTEGLPAQLIEKAIAGNRRAIARLITHAERTQNGTEAVVRALHHRTGNAQIVGITGAPGCGKSTLVNGVAKAFRQRVFPNGNHPQVAIVAVDPSSPFTGGALLGDRIRMRDLSGDAGIFIRSMASRGSLGGLAEATAAVVKIFDAVGFDLILIETVGAGQAEVEIAQTAPTTIVIEAPGMGDDVQSIKAGILEIADILVVNKADNPNAKQTIKGLRLMLSLNPTGTRIQPTEAYKWQLPLLETVATNGKGIDTLVDKILAHRKFLEESGELMVREEARCRQEIERYLFLQLMKEVDAKMPATNQQQLITQVVSRKLDPYSAADPTVSANTYANILLIITCYTTSRTIYDY